MNRSLKIEKSTNPTPEIEMLSLKKPNIDFALNLTQRNMANYYKKYGIMWDDENFRKDWEKTDNFSIRYLADDCVVGIARIAWNDTRTECYLKDLQIEPNFQGKGIGNSYLELLKMQVKNEGCLIMRLRVFVESPAIDLYERFGFEETGRDELLTEMALKI